MGLTARRRNRSTGKQTNNRPNVGFGDAIAISQVSSLYSSSLLLLVNPRKAYNVGWRIFNWRNSLMHHCVPAPCGVHRLSQVAHLR
jgi:hypothetical protein